MKHTFTISALFSNAWSDYKQYWKTILLVILTFALVQILPFIGADIDQQTGVMNQNGLGSLIAWFAGTWLTIGYYNFLLNIVDGKDAQYRDIFYGVKSVEQFAYFVLLSFIYPVVVGIGLIFLIIPGIILAIGLYFAQYYIAENRTGFGQAFRSSWEITKGNRLKIFGFGIVSGLFNILGFLALGIGLLITIPMTALMYARMFRNLEGIPLATGAQEVQETEE
jgi:uncharacterized membrane protein